MNSLQSPTTVNIRSFDDLTDSYETEQFCTLDSFDASSNYINILLTSYGYPVPLVFNSTLLEDKCKIVNCIHSILNDRKRDAKERQEFLYTINELKKKQDELETQVVQLKRENNMKDQTNAEIRSKYDANEASFKQHLSQNTRMKEEISKIKHDMQYMKTHYTHEANRHEQELAKTQDRLLKCMNHQYKSRVASLEINTQLADMIPNAADSDEVVQIRRKYDDLLIQVNNKERELRLENEDFRTCLINLYTSIRRLLEEQISQFDNQENIKNKPRDIHNETGRFRLPMQCGGKEAIKMVDDLLVRLKEEWDNQILHQPQSYTEKDMMEKEEEIHKLQEDLNELIHELNQLNQDHNEKLKVYQKYEKGGFFDTSYPNPQAAYISDDDDEEENVIEEESHKFLVLKKKVMRDQKKVTESAIELGYQRQQLQAERWAFQEMKRELELKEILKETPTTSSTSQSSVQFEKSDRSRKRLKSWFGYAPSNN